jgi:hypothetical protein
VRAAVALDDVAAQRVHAEDGQHELRPTEGVGGFERHLQREVPHQLAAGPRLPRDLCDAVLLPLRSPPWPASLQCTGVQVPKLCVECTRWLRWQRCISNQLGSNSRLSPRAALTPGCACTRAATTTSLSPHSARPAFAGNVRPACTRQRHWQRCDTEHTLHDTHCLTFRVWRPRSCTPVRHRRAASGVRERSVRQRGTLGWWWTSSRASGSHGWSHGGSARTSRRLQSSPYVIRYLQYALSQPGICHDHPAPVSARGCDAMLPAPSLPRPLRHRDFPCRLVGL